MKFVLDLCVTVLAVGVTIAVSVALGRFVYWAWNL